MFGVYRKGGSLGTVSNKPVYVTESKELAKSKARIYRSLLTAGERKYFKMSYVVRPYQEYIYNN